MIVDPTSLFYINGARIDYVDSLMGGGFSIENPNATSSCGCGSSFRTAQSHTGEADAGILQSLNRPGLPGSLLQDCPISGDDEMIPGHTGRVLFLGLT